MDDCLMLSVLTVLFCCYIVDAQEIEIFESSPLRVKAGNMRSIDCEVINPAANEDPQLAWLDKTGNRVSEIGRIHTARPPGAKHLSLVLLSIKEEDAGTYTCQGLINGQTSSKEISIETFKGITEVDCKRYQQPVAGKTAEIICDVKGGSAEFTTYWTFDNNQQIIDGYKDRFTTKTDRLIIQNISEEDNGVYKLNAQQRRLEFKVYDITVNVSIPPRIKKPPVLTPVIANDPFEMLCEAEGKPKPTYSWYKDGDPLPLGLPHYIVDKDNGSLRIESVTLDDEGTYICEANNSGGSVRARAELDVLVPPKIVKLENTTRNEGKNARLVCEATGDPAPSMTWQQEGTDNPYAFGPQTDNSDITVTSSPDLKNHRTKLVLDIHNLKPHDNANYTCTAENNVGNDRKTGRVIVRYKPNFDSQPYRETYGWHGFRNITCIANGMPEPVITWFKKGSNEELTTETPFYEVKNVQHVRQIISHLVVQVDFSNDDKVFTEYVCHAHNNLGRRNVTIKFIKAAAPGEPGVTLARHTPRTVELLVAEPSDVAGPAVSSYSVNYYIKGEPNENKTFEVAKEDDPRADDQSIPRTKITFDKLQPDTEYIFLISAVNAVGDGSAKRIEHETDEIREPYSVEILSPKVGKGVTTYKLKWEKPNDGGSSLLKYTLNYQEVSIKQNLTYGGDYIRDESLQGPKTVPKISPGSTVYELTNLEPDRYYEVEILAINNEGQSVPLPFIFRTQKASRSPITAASEDTERLPTWAVVVIVIVVFFILFIIVDMTCYFKNKCGVLMCVMERVGGGTTSEGKDKSATMEEGESKGLLSKEEDHEKEAAKKEEDVVVEEEKEIEDKEEEKSDITEEVEKAEEAQPDEMEKEKDVTEDLIEQKSEEAKETPTDSGDAA